MQGKPWVMKPVDIWKRAGPWALERATIECRKVMSSARLPSWGTKSETILPLWPRGENFQGDFMTVPRLPKKGVMVLAPFISTPWNFSSSGL